MCKTCGGYAYGALNLPKIQAKNQQNMFLANLAGNLAFTLVGGIFNLCKSSSNEEVDGGYVAPKTRPEETEETSEEAPADETKSEAYNKYCKKGGILAENSGYLISYLNEGRYDKLEDKIMAVVNAKIRQRIDAGKTKLKTEAFNKKFGK